MITSITFSYFEIKPESMLFETRSPVRYLKPKKWSLWFLEAWPGVLHFLVKGLIYWALLKPLSTNFVNILQFTPGKNGKH